jgi:hypothetical protein
MQTNRRRALQFWTHWISWRLTIVPNKEAEFKGVYVAHCLDERIRLEVDKWLGIVTRHESWKPTFPAGFAAPRGDWFPEPLLSNAKCLPFYIRFLGTPGDPQVCGYLGCCQRRVVVRKVLELREV